MLDVSEGIALITDGSSDYGNRSGGWAWVALDAFEGIEKDSGAASDTTNNQMELQAVVEGLKSLHRSHGPCNVLVYSDSQYVVYGINRGHKRNKNVGFWTALDDAIKLHYEVEFNHVKGHEGHIWNEMADQLAGSARKASLA